MCKNYYGQHEQCGDNYTGETVWNTFTCWSEHNNPDHKSEPAEHIKRNYAPPPSEKHLTKNLEAISVALYKPSLSNQKSFDTLMLFRNGITWFLIEMISCPKGYILQNMIHIHCLLIRIL